MESVKQFNIQKSNELIAKTRKKSFDMTGGPLIKTGSGNIPTSNVYRSILEKNKLSQNITPSKVPMRNIPIGAKILQKSGKTKMLA